MELSSIDLTDPKCVRRDDSGRSLAFFCKKTPVKVDAQLISALKSASDHLGGHDIRLCLHDSPEAEFHEMIILQCGGHYSRPHKHPIKGESYHIIEGSMAAFVFDEFGQVIDANVLDSSSSFLYRVGGNTYHMAVSLSELLIYHESRPGPFLRDTDSVFPSWAPDGTDAEQGLAYTKKLLQIIGIE